MYHYSPTILTLTIFLLSPATAEDIDIVSTITVTNAPSSTPPSAQYTDPPQLQSAALNSTNTYRHQHNASNVVWNDTLADYAKDHVKPCKFAHSGGPYGENLAQGYPDMTSAIDGWGMERKDYDFGEGKFDEDTGHFTQLVWQGTSAVGCAVKDCGKSGWLLFCEYSPQGNIIGKFTDNVNKQVNKDVNKTNTTGPGPFSNRPSSSASSFMSADSSVFFLALGLVLMFSGL